MSLRVIASDRVVWGGRVQCPRPSPLPRRGKTATVRALIRSLSGQRFLPGIDLEEIAREAARRAGVYRVWIGWPGSTQLCCSVGTAQHLNEGVKS